MELYVPDETSGPRYHIWKLVTSEPFENFILMLIVCNTILLMLKVGISGYKICLKEDNANPFSRFFPLF